MKHFFKHIFHITKKCAKKSVSLWLPAFLLPSHISAFDIYNKFSYTLKIPAYTPSYGVTPSTNSLKLAYLDDDKKFISDFNLTFTADMHFKTTFKIKVPDQTGYGRWWTGNNGWYYLNLCFSKTPYLDDEETCTTDDKSIDIEVNSSSTKLQKIYIYPSITGICNTGVVSHAEFVRRYLLDHPAQTKQILREIDLKYTIEVVI